MKKANVLLLICLGVMWFSALEAKAFGNKDATYASYSEEVIKDHVMNSSGLLAHNYDASVPILVKDNLHYGRKTFEKVITRTQMYFPIIQLYLGYYAIPDDLKYLVVVESQVNPHAVSECGAMGLWQLMPETARRYGLIVNEFQDDRKDPRKSTEVALTYLNYLHKLFNYDWTLAIAAYNCGEGRVRQAIRQANSDDFNKLREYLPKQTQKYISAFIAADYSIENYQVHGLNPKNVEYDLGFTSAIKIFDQMSFAEISNATNVSIDTLQKLNPSYEAGLVPDVRKGNYVVLPKDKGKKFRTFLESVKKFSVEMEF